MALQSAGAEPTSNAWFPSACASAHRIFRVALRQEQAAGEGGGRRWKRLETGEGRSPSLRRGLCYRPFAIMDQEDHALV